MPEKEGIETIMEFKRDFPDVKIIAILRGKHIRPEEYLHIAEMLGAQHTFAKPVQREHMIKAIKEILERP